MKQAQYPPGWDEARVERVVEHYDQLSDSEAAAEDDTALGAPTHTPWRPRRTLCRTSARLREIDIPGEAGGASALQ